MWNHRFLSRNTADREGKRVLSKFFLFILGLYLIPSFIYGRSNEPLHMIKARVCTNVPEEKQNRLRRYQAENKQAFAKYAEGARVELRKKIRNQVLFEDVEAMQRFLDQERARVLDKSDTGSKELIVKALRYSLYLSIEKFLGTKLKKSTVDKRQVIYRLSAQIHRDKRELLSKYPLLGRHIPKSKGQVFKKKSLADHILRSSFEEFDTEKLSEFQLLKERLFDLWDLGESSETIYLELDSSLDDIVQKETLLALPFTLDQELWLLMIDDMKSHQARLLEKVKGFKDLSFIEDFPEFAQIYFSKNSYELSQEDYVGFCMAPFGKSRRTLLQTSASFVGHVSFLVGAFIYPPWLSVSILAHALRFISEIGIDKEAVDYHRALSLEDGSFGLQRLVSASLKGLAAVASGLAIGSVGPALWGRHPISLIYPSLSVRDPEFIGYVYGNLLTNIFFAKGLLDQNINPLKEVSYYTDTVGNLVLYATLGDMSKALGFAKNPFLAGLNALPIVGLLVAIEDFNQSVLTLVDSRYFPDGRGQEYFAHVVPTLGVLNMYLHVIQVPVIQAVFGGGAGAMAMTHITNIARAAAIQIPGYDIAGEMFADPLMSYWEALKKSFIKYMPHSAEWRYRRCSVAAGQEC